jgi:flavodoxin
METAIINKPIHHGKTKDTAEVVANSLEAELYDLKDVNPNIMKEYDIIGFGSQLYWFKPHKKLRMFIEDLDRIENKKVFILSTSSYRENLLEA